MSWQTFCPKSKQHPQTRLKGCCLLSWRPLLRRVNTPPRNAISTKKPCSFWEQGFCYDVLTKRLFSRDVFVHVLATNECVVEQVNKASNDYPVANKVVAGGINNGVLQQRKDTTTANECHKDT